MLEGRKINSSVVLLYDVADIVQKMTDGKLAEPVGITTGREIHSLPFHKQTFG